MSDHAPAGTVPPLAPGFKANLKFDAVSGFLVFLIALPLCLGIAVASKYPPLAGIWTAVIGGVITGFISNSQLTIKGPAAGLIVIVEGAVLELGAHAAPGADLATQVAAGYPLALGIGVTAGVIQILFGLLKAGKLGELVPLTPVHGMLAAIGITIVAKQLFVMFGLAAPAGEPINAIIAVPSIFEKALNSSVVTIGVAALAIMILYPFLRARVSFLKAIPAQLVVLAVAIPLGLAFGLKGVAGGFLVNVPDLIPDVFGNPSIAFMFPNFAGVATATGLKYIVLFALIGTIESMLSSQAIDMIDPWKRKTDQNRDLLAVGLANTVCSLVGALPMISEIVRSKANIDNGARTKAANQFHGLFLLAFVLLLPFVIRMIPLAALGAMLVFTGFRLASPKEFVHTYKIGPEQLVVFVTTIAVTLCTDLLVGVLSGIVLKMVIHVLNGVPLGSFGRADVVAAHSDDERLGVLKVRRAAVFSNWLGVKKAILAEAEKRATVRVDLSETRFVDHSTMEKLHQLSSELGVVGKRLEVVGLERHKALSAHPLAARKATQGASAPVEAAGV
ncbi:MAG TPA: SulP family inorganic anion transporter [Gemmataceae bacterium]|nr:SulP family inorganic anion transporter [Gemmataceae bacterium]